MFAGYLRALEGNLDIPYPERSEVLTEIRSHLQDLFDEFRERGASSEEARRSAIDAIAVDEEFFVALSDVHRTAIARALARLPRHVSLGIEFAAIAFTGISTITIAIVMEVRMIEFFAVGGFFMFPLHLAAIAALLMTIERVYSLFLKRDHSVANLDKRLLSLKYIAVAAILIGLLGTAMGFFQAFTVGAAMNKPLPVYDVIAIALTTTIWGLTVSLFALTAHFVVRAKADRIARYRQLAT